ncbi:MULTISPECIES: hypothetical protein [Pseudomonas]|jgi:hypothetical protein|uniref:Uncharacterized protein n=1 Tax=Pseudomonas rhodesiae TaxID=76760 RepID=A0AAE8HBD5_9PSED|nr:MULTISPECIES: hypothetical protein [Pseudomonas]MBB4815363.1 hypothetical protein [Pseudomonas rhodesiae]MDN6863148.1 hypothetical protein [Pseudomonas rhodesiae]WHT78439.1 hypothetical protein QMY54_03223 [Pseudomonas rhodesiae]WLG37188.1 hypothetical protein PSH93_14335 [Pseudomonas rhodesiae]WLI27183.1 hypothetical protein PSH61_15190 [Pseudomonas rhodesiae]
MALRLAAAILFLYSAPILSSVQPLEGEPEVAHERLLNLAQG